MAVINGSDYRADNWLSVRYLRGYGGRTRDIPHSTSNGDCHYPLPCHLCNLVEFLARPSIECASLWRHGIRHFKVAIQAQILTSEIELIHYGLRGSVDPGP